MTRELVRNLIELLNVRSDTNEGKKALFELVRSKLEELGLSVVVGGAHDSPAMLASNGSGGIAFAAHLDTVPAGDDWTKEDGEVEAGRVYGLGAADMKGGMAAMMAAARVLREEEVPFTLLITTDEEELMTGAEFLAKRPEVRRASGILVGEPTDLRVAWKEKGISRLTLTAHGVAAHASMPWNGDNAIMRMASLLDKLDPMLKVPEGPTDDLTLVVSTIRGGTRNNIVPDRCDAQLNARFPYPLTAKEVRERIMRTLEGESYDMIMQYELPAFETSPDTALIRELLDAGADGIFAVPYATEAAVYSTVNPLVAVCGPGSPNMAHTKDEYVERWQLERAFRLYCEMGRRLQG
ncbi:MAG: M20/M25/M40 family metallo-hydrolase [Methanomassiliicoccales archaeon]|jgi:acetylornithine deacetylase/succinyl-diaminopimelate desuccinylase-like protein|nr:M20/M25/M40 family metallo-hydrolase [Methanomassiliicoccales archaeon]